MKVVYVGDNRNRGNYGCRGTSTALSQLIGKNNEIVGRITGRYDFFDTGELYCVKGKNEEFYTRKSRHKLWKYEKRFLHYYHRFLDRGGRYLLGKHDFASLDFEEAINNLIACIPANPLMKEFDLRQYEFDALVVNGEGSFIFAEKPWRESVIEAMEMYWAKKMGKKVFYLNGMLSDDPHSNHNQKTIDAMQKVFKSCDEVCVREYESLKYAYKYFPGIKVKLFPDALFTWYDVINDAHRVENGRYYIPHSKECDEAYYNYDFTKPYACISGSSAIMEGCNENIELAIQAYAKLVEMAKKKLKMNIFLVHVDEGDEFLNKVSEITNTPIVAMDTPLVAAAKILANARVYISGRYHPAIMAALGGTPCVFMSSNSHKTRSIQELLNYKEIKEYNLVPNDEECNLILRDALLKIEQAGLRDRIKERAYVLNIQAKELANIVK